MLTEIVIKRMEPQVKMEHLAALQIVSMLAEGLSSASIAVTAKLAALISALALEQLDCWDRLAAATPSTPASAMLVAQATEMLSQTFPLLLSCFATDDMETSQVTLAFLHSYIGRLRKLLASSKELNSHEGHLQHLLLVMGTKSVFPADFDFERPDEAEEAFMAYRRELSTLVKGVARVHPTLAQDFVQRTLNATLESIESSPWAHLEVALWLLYTLGEGLPDSLLREKGGYFERLMETLLSSRAPSYPHRSVQLLYFEIVVRYYRFFLTHPTYLTGVLSTFLSEVGLFNPAASVRSRACYLLLRFVKQTIKFAPPEYFEVLTTLRGVLAHQRTDVEYSELVAQGITGGITSPPSGSTSGRVSGNELAREHPSLSDVEQGHIFEVCGLLLGGNLAPTAQVGEQLRLLLDRPIAQLQLLCAHAAGGEPNGHLAAAPLPGNERQALNGSQQQLVLTRAAEAAFQISVIAYVSKGFGELPAESVLLRETFSRATQVALAAMASFGDAPEVRSRALMLLHRMIETLGETLLSYIDSALPQLLARADAKDLVELVTLVNQLLLKFRSKISAPAAALFNSLVEATFSNLQQLDAAIASSSSAAADASAPASDDVRERRALLRCFYSLVHSLLHAGLAEVLTSPTNAAHVEPALRLLLTGCVEGPDLTQQRQCFTILQELVSLWVGSIPGFDAFVLRDVLPVCFSAIAQPHFSLKDAAALPLLEASATLQKAILAKLGADVLAGYLRNQLLPSLGCSPELAAEYARQVCEGDARHLRDFIKVQLLNGRQ